MIKVLKLDHRPYRDKRINTHCALVARAFGANNFFYSGIEDNHLEDSVKKVNDDWGKTIEIDYVEKPVQLIKKHKQEKFTIVHLTMYGERLEEKIQEIKQKENILILIGGPKVDSDFYQLADYNISVTNQPQSEVGALTLIMYFLNPDYLSKDKFEKSKKKIIPSKNRKNIITLK